jgi:hypothetical protein
MKITRLTQSLLAAAIVTTAFSVHAQDMQMQQPQSQPMQLAPQVSPSQAMQPQSMPMSPARMQAAQQLQALPQPVVQGDVTYITGGVGDDERAALEGAKQDYNLQVTNADVKGHFTADITITVRGSGKNGAMINTVSAGPLFYAKLPAGHYTIEATNGAEHLVRKVNIDNSKAADVRLIW